MSIVLIIIISYLIGSIQSGILIGKIIYKTDVRQLGSKSSGATNIQRTIGLKPGIVVLVLDILKGFLPILFIEIFTEENVYREKIEKYLSQSANTYDLEQRMRELEQKGKYLSLIHI